MAATAVAEDLRRKDAVVAAVDLRDVPAGTKGKVVIVNGLKWIRYWVRFDNGVASSLDVLDAQRELFSAQQSLVQARLQRTTSAVDLYRALGGGIK